MHSIVVTGRELDAAGQVHKRAWGVVTDLDVARSAAAIDDLSTLDVAGNLGWARG